MKQRRSGFGLLILILTLALVAYIWVQHVNKTVDPNYGLLDMIKGAGDSIARRFGRG